ncbi:hypothetical protein [Micromonospora sp. URMC 103]|uniref:hypothetical protein n=1 Tax=Micromonospora sp. URMC 103 TaxID=3423406 RepID=UPI003F1BC384
MDLDDFVTAPFADPADAGPICLAVVAAAGTFRADELIDTAVVSPEPSAAVHMRAVVRHEFL